jgi:hypothetical protein
MPVQNKRRWRCSKCHLIHETSYQINDCPQNKHTYQGCTNSGHQVAVVTECCMAAPNFFGFSVRNLLHVTLLAPRILRQLKEFWKICAPFTRYVFVEDDAFAFTPHPMQSYPRTYDKERKESFQLSSFKFQPDRWKISASVLRVFRKPTLSETDLVSNSGVPRNFFFGGGGGGVQ